MNPNLPSPARAAGLALAAIVTGFVCYVNLLGLEKGLLAVVFGWLAWRERHNLDAKSIKFAKWGLILGAIAVVSTPIVLYLMRDQVAPLIACYKGFLESLKFPAK